MSDIINDVSAFCIAFGIIIVALCFYNALQKKKSKKQKELNIITARKLRGSPRRPK